MDKRILMRRYLMSAAAALLATAAVALPASSAPGGAGGTLAASRAEAATGTPIQIYGAWHCSNDACLWGTVRTISDFDANNHWLIDRGDGRPSVNLVVLSFVNPLKL